MWMERAKNKPVEIFRGKLPDLFLSYIHTYIYRIFERVFFISENISSVLIGASCRYF
jgi:hypothetical protein